jgi:hypothetical protein
MAEERKSVSPFVGRPMTTSSARRFVGAQRDRALLRLWRGAPEAVSYLVAVVKGTAEFNEGKFKAASQILSRTLPTITAQAVESNATNVSVSAVVGDGKSVASAVGDDLRARLDRLERHERMMAEIRNGSVTDVSEAKE